MAEEKQSSYRIIWPESTKAKFKSLCALKNTNMNQVLLELVERWIQETEKEIERGKKL
ncbi:MULTISPECIES: hypothetical protein [Nostocaceae]|uniref:hypothetical protein n=1 Tax=Nostocaceae TaxID=1162 RepID=UPI0018EF4D2A|nr:MULTISPECIES: hypothetical protein [Nostocaceae]